MRDRKFDLLSGSAYTPKVVRCSLNALVTENFADEVSIVGEEKRSITLSMKFIINSFRLR